MIVTCDNCGTRYNLPEAKIPAGGAKVKCSKCAHVFKVVPPAQEPEPEEDDLLAGLGDDLDDTPPPEDVGGPADEPAAPPSEEPSEEEEPEDDLPDDFPDDDDDLDGLPDDDDLDDLPDDFDDLPGGADDEPAEEEDDLDDLFGDDDDDLDDDLPFGDEEEDEKDEFEEDEDEEEEDDDFEDDEEEFEEDEEEDFDDDDEGFAGSTDLGLDDAGRDKGKSGPAGLLKILIPVLVVVLLGGGVWYFQAWKYIPFLGGDDDVAEAPVDQPAGQPAEQSDGQEPSAGGKVAAPDSPPASSPAEQVKNIGLVKVRQFYVTNEKTSNKLFVIEGNAVNNFSIPKELIKVEATLYDGSGKVVAQHAQVAGNTLSLFQLQVMTGEQITEALASEVGILTNNTFLRPGMDVPFMLVFFDVPATVKEFGVKVVEAKDPPKE